MVGSRDSIAGPNVVINTIVAEAFAEAWSASSFVYLMTAGINCLLAISIMVRASILIAFA